MSRPEFEPMTRHTGELSPDEADRRSGQRVPVDGRAGGLTPSQLVRSRRVRNLFARLDDLANRSFGPGRPGYKHRLLSLKLVKNEPLRDLETNVRGRGKRLGLAKGNLIHTSRRVRSDELAIAVDLHERSTDVR